MLIVDAHQDLAWNMLSFGRDYSRPLTENRRLEVGELAPQVNGDTLLGWDVYQRGQVAVIFASLFAAPQRYVTADWETQWYADFSQANHLYRRQAEHYHRFTDDHPDKFRLVQSRSDLQAVLCAWKEPESEYQAKAECPVGLVISMEGAEAVRDPGELEEWWGLGVRLIGPAWAGNHFCGGTGQPGRLTPEGIALLEAMAGYGFGLDLSHMDEAAAMQALDLYPGRLFASHSNAQALLKGLDSNRHLSDRLIQGILERDGVIGVVPFNRFLRAGWKIGDRREEVSLVDLLAHIDHICQLAGDSRHTGIGSDFDGGFGWQSVPDEIDSIADLQKLVPLLLARGYTEDDVTNILGENWLRLMQSVLT